MYEHYKVTWPNEHLTFAFCANILLGEGVELYFMGGSQRDAALSVLPENTKH